MNLRFGKNVETEYSVIPHKISKTFMPPIFLSWAFTIELRFWADKNNGKRNAKGNIFLIRLIQALIFNDRFSNFLIKMSQTYKTASSYAI